MKRELTEEELARLSREADNIIRQATTGADGVCRAEALADEFRDELLRCEGALVDVLYRISREEGCGAVASVSAGGESVSFRAPAFARAAGDPELRRRLLYATVTEHLGGLRGRDGLPLLAAV